MTAGDNEHLAGERGDLRGREGLVGEDAGDVANDEHVAAVVWKDDSSSATFLRDALAARARALPGRDCNVGDVEPDFPSDVGFAELVGKS